MNLVMKIFLLLNKHNFYKVVFYILYFKSISQSIMHIYICHDRKHTSCQNQIHVFEWVVCGRLDGWDDADCSSYCVVQQRGASEI